MSTATLKLALAPKTEGEGVMERSTNPRLRVVHIYTLHGKRYRVACDRRRIHGEESDSTLDDGTPIGDIQSIIPAPDARESHPMPDMRDIGAIDGLVGNSAGVPLVPVGFRAFNATFVSDALAHVGKQGTAWTRKGTVSKSDEALFLLSKDGKRFAHIMPVRLECDDAREFARSTNASILEESRERFTLSGETITDTATGEKYAGDEKILGLIRSLEKGKAAS